MHVGPFTRINKCIVCATQHLRSAEAAGKAPLIFGQHLCKHESPKPLPSQHLRDAEAAGGAPFVVEQHLRHVLGQRHRDLYHAQIVQEPARPPGLRN